MSTNPITPYLLTEVAPLAAFLSAYRQAFPAARLLPAAFYLQHPALEQGRNLLVAWDDAENLAGFAPLFLTPAPSDAPAADPHTVWTLVLAEPSIAGGDAVRAPLLEAVLRRARELVASLPPRPARLAVELLASQTAELRFLLAHGFASFDQVIVLERTPPAQPLAVPGPAGISTRTSDLTAAADQAAYLAVYNRCFPERPKTRDDLRLLVEAPFWQRGSAIFAEDAGGRLVGSVLIYPDAAGAGVTDDVFVEPGWRGRGVARYLVAAGLDRMRAQGLARARLEVRRSNASALALYEALGYARVDEQLLLAREL